MSELRDHVKQAMRIHLTQLVVLHPDSACLTTRTIFNMVDSLYNWNIDAIDKFIVGQKEHGGDLASRSLMVEIRNEQLDLFWYSAAMGWEKQQ